MSTNSNEQAESSDVYQLIFGQYGLFEREFHALVQEVVTDVDGVELLATSRGESRFGASGEYESALIALTGGFLNRPIQRVIAELARRHGIPTVAMQMVRTTDRIVKFKEDEQLHSDDMFTIDFDDDEEESD